MYQSQSNYGFGSQQQMGQQVGAQYRGMQRTFQPTGYVQSSYNPNASFSQSMTQNPQASSYHTASYRGNQPGHDQYLRSDSSQPTASSGFGQQTIQGGFSQSQPSYSSMQTQGFGQSTNAYGIQQSPEAYHMANYRGNQPGHDQYLRSDSNQPNASSAYGQQPGQSMFTPSQGAAFNQSFNEGLSTIGTTNSIYQQQSPQAYHTASYRGNQPGHDQYLRADSTQPTQNQTQFYSR